jgi:hypothetical protein
MYESNTNAFIHVQFQELIRGGITSFYFVRYKIAESYKSAN